MVKTFKEAQSELLDIEHNLSKMNIHSDFSTHYGILFFDVSKETKLDDLPRTKTWNGEINHGEIMLRIISEQRELLANAIKTHPVIAKRAGLRV
jgi:hypothetical protein